MALSNVLISEFVKVTNDDKKTHTGATVYGTAKEYGGEMYVQLDGSDLLTPIETTTNVKDGERVTVTVKNHTATVDGNLSSPAARDEEVKDVNQRVDEYDVIIADKVSTDYLEANYIKAGEIEAEYVKTEKLEAEYATIGKLEAEYATIKELHADYATIDQLDAKYATIHKLESEYATITNLNAVNAKIENLDVENLEATYANIDFANIGEAAIENLFAKSGIIGDLVMSEGHVTGTLVGVTIKGDLIEAGTLVADALVIQGEDGLYYQLNTNGETVTSQQTDYNSLNGSIITAQSVTADKINVTDLVAFGATIGGFHITDASLYSGVKQSVDNTTRGVYLDAEGQIAFGDTNGYVKYYRDDSGEENYHLEILAESISLTAKGDVGESLDNAQSAADSANNNASDASTKAGEVAAELKMLSDKFNVFIADAESASLMTQTENGWVFSTAETAETVNTLSQKLNDLEQTSIDTNTTVESLQQAVNDIGDTMEYVRIGVYEDEPCIELGESDSDYALMITNTRIMFRVGSNIPTLINHDGLVTENIEVKNELRQGNYVWMQRNNGHYSLQWKAVSE